MEEGSPRILFSRPRHPYTIALLGTFAAGEGSASAAAQAPDTSHEAAGCRYFSRCAYREERCALQKPPREEIEPGHSVACFAWRRVEADRKRDRR